MSDVVVRFFRDVIETISSYIPTLLSVGEIMTLIILFALPGLLLAVVLRFVLRHTATFLGKTDALLVGWFFSVVVGAVLGGVVLDSWQRDSLSLSVAGCVWLSSAGGVFFGGKQTLGWRRALWLPTSLSGAVPISVPLWLLA